MAFRPESTLNPKTLRREAVQLGVVVIGSLAVLFTGVRALQIVVGIIDVLACIITGIAATVAWRVGGRGVSVGLYAAASPVFAVLAVLNFI
ncbi:MAG TPA: hypothetical protein VFJ93_00540 [Gaiellaceae bacterium]|nr:hypothetical protein [Gaiellaceae bacterium]